MFCFQETNEIVAIKKFKDSEGNGSSKFGFIVLPFLSCQPYLNVLNWKEIWVQREKHVVHLTGPFLYIYESESE